MTNIHGPSSITDDLQGQSSLLPSYNQAENEEILRLCIVENPRDESSASPQRVITANPISSSGHFNNLNGTRSYYPRYKGRFTFSISCQSSKAPLISYSPLSKDTGRFTLSQVDTDQESIVFPLDVRCSRIKIPHVNSLLEQFQPLNVNLLTQAEKSESSQLRSYTWRAVPQNDPAEKLIKKSKGPEVPPNVDLVLLNEEFKETAYFTNQLKPMHEGGNVWGTVEIKNRINDGLLIDQILLTLLALVHVYHDKASNAGKWTEYAMGVMSGSIACEVM